MVEVGTTAGVTVTAASIVVCAATAGTPANVAACTAATTATATATATAVGPVSPVQQGDPKQFENCHGYRFVICMQRLSTDSSTASPDTAFSDNAATAAATTAAATSGRTATAAATAEPAGDRHQRIHMTLDALQHHS
jgi:hypothetical protein